MVLWNVISISSQESENPISGFVAEVEIKL